MSKTELADDVLRAAVNEWLDVRTGRRPAPVDRPIFLKVTFPSDAVRDGYLSCIRSRSDEEVRGILRGMVGESRDIEFWDELRVQQIKLAADPASGYSDGRPAHWPRFSELDRRILLRSFGKRNVPAWEGLTWVLDLLPQSPHEALSVISAYMSAYAGLLHDTPLLALSDAQAVIRTRYIETGADDTSRVRLLAVLDWRDFEYFVALVWRDQGYEEVSMTPPAKDRGKDVIATRLPPNGESVYIECKNGSVGADVNDVMKLFARVEMDRASRGVVVATNGFTSGEASAREFEKQCGGRLELLDGRQLVSLANRYVGHDWPDRLERLLRFARQSIPEVRGDTPLGRKSL